MALLINAMVSSRLDYCSAFCAGLPLKTMVGTEGFNWNSLLLKCFMKQALSHLSTCHDKK